MAEKKIADGISAEAAVRRELEARYGDKLKDVSFRKSWLTSSVNQQLWEVEGTLKRKAGVLKTETRSFKYQIDAVSGMIIGHEEVTPK
ncbi:MAG: hypothetical protein Q8O05_04550 [Chloroflexota bacterium]|nr:hypothetical protein [Chloroflexota bacterium]